MKRSRIVIVVAVVGVVAAIYLSLPKAEVDPAAYAAQIQKDRKEKDEFMRSGDGSPFVADSVLFSGLAYFPPDPSYQITARLEPITKKEVMVLGTSDGQTKTYLPYAFAHFDLGGKKNRLLILEVMDPGPFRGTLFLAFADATSTTETYGAGRYLDVKKVAGATTIILDFNKAYNPYCAYTDTYSCPLPPRENVLEIPIPAGEKLYTSR